MAGDLVGGTYTDDDGTVWPPVSGLQYALRAKKVIELRAENDALTARLSTIEAETRADEREKCANAIRDLNKMKSGHEWVHDSLWAKILSVAEHALRKAPPVAPLAAAKGEG